MEKKIQVIIRAYSYTVTRFLYANEAHNILMTGFGMHERFTIEMRTCVQHAPKNISISKKIQNTTAENLNNTWYIRFQVVISK